MFQFLKCWNIYELFWLVLFIIIAMIITILTKDSFFGFTIFISGVLCVVLAAKGNIMTYPIGVYNTVAYAWLAYQNGFFGEMGLNLFFFMPMNIIGFVLWKRHTTTNGQVIMRKMTGIRLFFIALSCLVCTLLLGFAFSLIAGQNAPYIDATTNILSIGATILMVRRYREQWILYILLNIFTVLMWSIRTFNGSLDGPIMIVMWSAYLVNAFYGLFNWTKGAGKKSGLV